MQNVSTNTTVARVLKLGNVKLFENTRPNVEVILGKGNRQQAKYSYFDSVQGYDIRVSDLVQAASGRNYTKMTLSLSLNGSRTFYNGILNTVKKVGSAFAYTGYVEVDGVKLKVMVKGKGQGKYYPVTFSVDKSAVQAAAPTQPTLVTPQGDSKQDTSVPF